MIGPKRLELALRRVGVVLDRLSADELDRPSACSGWCVVDVIEHLIAVTDKFTAFANGHTDQPRQRPVPLLERDSRAAFAKAELASGEAWSTHPKALERTCVLPFGSFDGATAAGINAFDALVHGWDIAVAVGAPYEPDDAECRAAIEIARLLVSPDGRAEGHYAAAISTDSDSPFDQLLALTGRELRSAGVDGS